VVQPVLAVLAACLGVGPLPFETDGHGMTLVMVSGFEARVSADLLDEPGLCRRVLDTLRSDLTTIERALPDPAFSALRDRVVIWIEKQGATVPGGMSGRGMVYHPSAIWLKANGLDPRRAGGIEIVRARDYLDWRDEQPMMVLHELAHAQHHMIGIDHAGIAAAYENAKASGRYQRVRYVLAGEGERREAYAMVSATEYFSELTEAYFGRNDFEPFDRGGLRAFDPAGFAVIESVWSREAPEP